MSVLIKLRDMRNLPEAENEVREYILQNSADLLEMTVYDVAKKSYTSPATVIRLCKKLDLKGFNQLKIKLASEIRWFDSIQLDIMDVTNVSPEDSPLAIIDKITNMELRSIEETRMLLDEKKLVQAAERLHKATIINFFGVGASNIVAFDATYKFMRIGKNAACYQLYDRQYVQAVNSDSSHVAIIVSYSGETKEMLQVLDELQKNGCYVIAITSSSKNTLSDLADNSIAVSSKETMFRSGAMASRITQLYIVDILFALCCQYDYENVKTKVIKTRISNTDKVS